PPGRAIVTPNETVSSNHVQPVRKANRAAAARNNAKNSTSGTPRFAAVCSPGIGNAYDKVVKTCAWCVTITFVGPFQTEYASTQGMMNATSTTQAAVSKYARNQNPISVTEKSFTMFSGVFHPATCRTTVKTASASPTGSRPRALHNGRASHTSPNETGISTPPMNATSHQSDAFHRCACTVSYAARAATTASRAEARPTIDRAG